MGSRSVGVRKWGVVILFAIALAACSKPSAIESKVGELCRSAIFNSKKTVSGDLNRLIGKSDVKVRAHRTMTGVVPDWWKLDIVYRGRKLTSLAISGGRDCDLRPTPNITP
jgi:hypothetical protein